MIDEDTAIEIICAASGKDTLETEEQFEAAADWVENEYGIDPTAAAVLLTKLAPLCIRSQGALTGRLYAGFAKDGAFIGKVWIDDE